LAKVFSHSNSNWRKRAQRAAQAGRTPSTSGRFSRIDLMPASSSSSSSESEEDAARFASVAVDGETISTGAAAAAEASKKKVTALLEHRRNREETAGGRPAAARRAREQEEDEGNRLPPAVREKVRERERKRVERGRRWGLSSAAFPFSSPPPAHSDKAFPLLFLSFRAKHSSGRPSSASSKPRSTSAMEKSRRRSRRKRARARTRSPTTTTTTATTTPESGSLAPCPWGPPSSQTSPTVRRKPLPSRER